MWDIAEHRGWSGESCGPKVAEHDEHCGAPNLTFMQDYCI